MKRYFCDYCGCEVESAIDTLNLVAITHENTEEYNYGDFCRNCIGKVDLFLKQLKEPMK